LALEQQFRSVNSARPPEQRLNMKSPSIIIQLMMVMMLVERNGCLLNNPKGNRKKRVSDVTEIKLESVQGNDYLDGKPVEKALTIQITGRKEGAKATLVKKDILFNDHLEIQECQNGDCSTTIIGQEVTDELRDCNYKGTMLNDPASVVAVSDCGGVLNLGLISEKTQLRSTTYKQTKEGPVIFDESHLQEIKPIPKDPTDLLARNITSRLIDQEAFFKNNALFEVELNKGSPDQSGDCCTLRKRTCVQTGNKKRLKCTIKRSRERCGEDCKKMQKLVRENAKINLDNVIRMQKNGKKDRRPKKIPITQITTTIEMTTPTTTTTTTPTEPTTIYAETNDIETTEPTTTTTEPTTTAEPEVSSEPTFDDDESYYDSEKDKSVEEEDPIYTEDKASKNVKHLLHDELVKILDSTKDKKMRNKTDEVQHRSTPVNMIRTLCTGGPCAQKKDNPKKKIYKERTIEVGIVTDKFLWEKMKEQSGGDDNEVKQLMLKMVHSLMVSTEVHLLHESISSMGGFHVAINGLTIWKDDSTPEVARIHATTDQDDTLSEFSKWVRVNNNPYDGFNDSYDIMILLSGGHAKYGLAEGADAGVAALNAVCGVDCAVLVTVTLVDKNHASNNGALLAHEMGHSLGAYHDGEFGRDRVLQDCPLNKYIMTPSQSGDITTWSTCSRNQIDNEYERRGRERPTSGNCFYT